MMRKLKRTLASVVVLVLAAAIAWVYAEIKGSNTQPSDDVPSNAEGPYEVERVVDGDTLKINDSSDEVTIRLIGVDTPETKHPNKGVECWGPEATDLMEDLAEGENVFLEDDDTQETVDRYDRRLAYVWKKDGTLLNLEMITQGAGREYTYDKPYKYVESFKSAESDARKNSLGLWGNC